MQRIKKGDFVRVISGDEATKEGIVTKVLPKQNAAIVEGLNIIKVHQKPDQNNKNNNTNNNNETKNILSKDSQDSDDETKTKDKNNKKIRSAKKTNTEIIVGKKK